MKLQDSTKFQEELKALMKKYNAQMYPTHNGCGGRVINLDFGIGQGYYDIEDIVMINEEGLTVK